MTSAGGGGAEIPPGWDYNPSSWEERLPLLALALLGVAISFYLTLFQVGAISQMWDPIFGSASSAAVIHSPISRLLPIPDASLGALAYLAEVVLGALGGPARWRTLPAVVLLYGLVALGLGVVSTLLLITQGALVHAWCLLCLGSAAISLTILGVCFGETLAALQHLKDAARRHESLPRALLGLPSAHAYPRQAAYQ
jgi:uncharacterized membrane protein